MSENNTAPKKTFSLDWLMQGVLTRIGETFDRLTGRGWQPSSSLATSELIERLKKLLDAEVKDLGEKGKFVPHNIKLKMQWDKFSSDAESALRRLEDELLVAAVDHINDNRYHTFAPMKVEVKADYFTEGVKLLASFDKFDETEREVAINVTVPQIKVGDYVPPPEPESETVEPTEKFVARFSSNGRPKQVELSFKSGQRRTVGRNKGNDLVLDESSVSKIHAALVLGSESQLMVADTGSTNGTFLDDKRIAYGKAVPIRQSGRVKFGTVEVVFEHVPKGDETAAPGTSAGSQNAIQTVAFTSDPDLDDKTMPPSPTAPGDGAVSSQSEHSGGQAERPSSSPGTQDRIVFDFSKDD